MPGPARIVAFGMGLMGAVTASQAPEFAQQYRQRLGGAIDELATVVQRFDHDARSVGQGREEALRRLTGNADELVRRQAEGMRAAVARLDRLRDQSRAMAQAGPFGRVAALATQADPAIVRAAYRDFEPAVPVTMEGAVATLTGFAAAWAFALGLIKGTARLARRRPQSSAVRGLPERRM